MQVLEFLDGIRSSWGGYFHASEGGFRQGRYGVKGAVVLVFGNKNVNWKGGLLFVENCQETSRRDKTNKRSLELCIIPQE
jgi:hypothetical protein